MRYLYEICGLGTSIGMIAPQAGDVNAPLPRVRKSLSAGVLVLRGQKRPSPRKSRILLRSPFRLR